MSSQRERGGPLTAWLALTLAANIVASSLYIVIATYPVAYKLFIPKIALWTTETFIALGALNVAFICFLFLWKKWAFFGLCGSTIFTMALNFYVGVGVPSIVGIFAVIIMYMLLRPKWQQLDDI